MVEVDIAGAEVDICKVVEFAKIESDCRAKRHAADDENRIEVACDARRNVVVEKIICRINDGDAWNHEERAGDDGVHRCR